MKIVHFDPLNRQSEIGVALSSIDAVDYFVLRNEEDLRRVLPGAETLIIGNRFYTKTAAAIILAEGKTLSWIQFTSSGFDNATAFGLPSGVIVTNCAGSRAFSVAEHAFALMLALARSFQATESARVEGRWSREAVTPLLTNLAEKHLLIVGTGAVATELARRAKAFDMRISGISRKPRSVPNFDAVRPRADLSAACSEADFVVLATALDASSKALIDAKTIAQIRPNAFLINVARGGMIDHDALAEALNAGRIGGAGLDVAPVEPMPPDFALWCTKNLILTPHIAGAGSYRTSVGEGSIVADNVSRRLASETLKNIVVEKTP